MVSVNIEIIAAALAWLPGEFAATDSGLDGFVSPPFFRVLRFPEPPVARSTPPQASRVAFEAYEAQSLLATALPAAVHRQRAAACGT